MRVRDVVRIGVERGKVRTRLGDFRGHVRGTLTTPVIKKIPQETLGTSLVETLESRHQLVGVVLELFDLEYRIAPLEVSGSLTNEPVPQRQRRGDVVTVVARYGDQDRRVARLHVLLVFNNGSGSLFDSTPPMKIGQLLQVLKPVGLSSHHDGVLGHDKQVDEETTLDERIQEDLAFGSPSQSFKSRSFRVVVVVHVHEWELTTPFGEELNEFSDHRGLLFEIVGPTLVV